MPFAFSCYSVFPKPTVPSTQFCLLLSFTSPPAYITSHSSIPIKPFLTLPHIFPRLDPLFVLFVGQWESVGELDGHRYHTLLSAVLSALSVRFPLFIHRPLLLFFHLPNTLTQNFLILAIRQYFARFHLLIISFSVKAFRHFPAQMFIIVLYSWPYFSWSRRQSYTHYIYLPLFTFLLMESSNNFFSCHIPAHISILAFVVSLIISVPFIFLLSHGSIMMYFFSACPPPLAFPRFSPQPNVLTPPPKTPLPIRGKK